MSPKGEGFKPMGFWGAGGPFLVLKTSEMNLRCQNLSPMADAATDFEIFASYDSYVNLYVALFSLNIYRPFEGLPAGPS